MVFIAVALYLSEVNGPSLEESLLRYGYTQEAIDLAYTIGDETGDYGILDEAIE